MNVYLSNRSTVLSDTDVQRIVQALDIQAQRDYGKYWRSDIRCLFLPAGQTVPGGSAVLQLLDSCDQPGALGYHDETGSEVPYGRVGVRTVLQNGQEPSEVASHELLELATDPHVNLTAPTGDLSRLYALEVGDPCQGEGYNITLPDGSTVKVADFVLPKYFDPRTSSTVHTDFRGALHGPFALGPQGYFSFVDLSDVQAGWRQQVGSERKGPPPVDADDRVIRRRWDLRSTWRAQLFGHKPNPRP